MKGLRFFSLVTIVLSVAAVTLEGSPARAQAPSVCAAGTVMGGSKFLKAYPANMQIVWDAQYKRYQITIPSIYSGQTLNYDAQHFVTVVTPRPTSSDDVISAGAGEVDGKLLVSLYDKKGNRVQGQFEFVTYAFAPPIQ